VGKTKEKRRHRVAGGGDGAALLALLAEAAEQQRQTAQDGAAQTLREVVEFQPIELARTGLQVNHVQPHLPTKRSVYPFIRLQWGVEVEPPNQKLS